MVFRLCGLRTLSIDRQYPRTGILYLWPPRIERYRSVGTQGGVIYLSGESSLREDSWFTRGSGGMGGRMFSFPIGSTSGVNVKGALAETSEI